MNLLGPVLYTVEKIDGDYALLRPENTQELNQVARALLPADIVEGGQVLWENLSYSIVED